jgi:UDP-2,3-diacylglucosamine pyrophosphatase LpxH
MRTPRTLILSDLHLGADGRLPHADGELCNLLRGEPWARLILVGDVFDLWELPYFEIKKKHLAAVATIRAMKCPVIFIPGNHDDAFRGFSRLDEMQVEWPTFQLQSGGKRFVFAHGDTYSAIPEGIAKIGYWITGLIGRICSWFAGPGVSFRRTLRYSLANSGIVNEAFSEKIAKLAVAGLEGDVIVLGHTHIPVEPCEIDGKIYANLGDFGPEHLTYAVLEDGVLTLKKLA